ncbi:Cupredoxin [Chiua virens]|nr:Cupredoxin [Chiua virens]
MLLLPLFVLSLFFSNVLSVPPPQASGSTKDIVDGSAAEGSGTDGNLASVPHPHTTGLADDDEVDDSTVDDGGDDEGVDDDGEAEGSLPSISHSQATGITDDDKVDDVDVDDSEADPDVSDVDVIDADVDDDADADDDANVDDGDVAGNDTEPSARKRPRPGRPVRRQLRIVNRNIAPDGFRRSAVLANGVFPGPLITARKGRRAAIRVTNQLRNTNMDVETSVHWHGIFQTRTNWADGVPWVTQCPIKQQKSFLYRFNIGKQSGTHWYHSHYGVQYCDGLRGPLVIYDPRDPHRRRYDVDNARTVITLSDWYHNLGPQLGNILAAVPANSTLINGRGRYPGGPRSSLAVIRVRRGLRYRFRVISMSCDPWFNFTIDGHRMTIIEADGSEVKPVRVDSLPVFAGQRYSVVVKANRPVGNYWIRASTNQNGNFTGGINSAILRYVGAPRREPRSRPGPYKLAFDEGKLHPLRNPRAPGRPGIGNADVSLQLTPSLDPSTRLWQINNVTWKDPSTPVLLQILSGKLHPSQLMPSGSLYELPPNKVIEISFPNNAPLLPGKPHPIHLHGHDFSVVRVSGSKTTNFVNPVRRDVVSMGTDPSDNVTIRFRTDNPGPWIIHCHIDWHLHHGFAVVMAESTGQTSKMRPPVDWRRLCN